MRENLSKQGVDVDTLSTGSTHHYRCKCQVCLRWWVLVGPEIEESDKDGNPTKWNYGPFSDAEIDEAKRKGY